MSHELGNYPPVEAAASIMREIIYNNAGQLSASMICSGWDPYKGYQIYSVNQTGFFKEANWALSGSGSTFIWGWYWCGWFHGLFPTDGFYQSYDHAGE